MDVHRTFVLHIFSYGRETWTRTKVRMGPARGHSYLSSPLHFWREADRTATVLRRRTLQWMGHVLLMDEDRLPRQGCHEEGSGGGTNFRDFQKLPSHTKLIPRSRIRAAAAERALDRQAWRDAVKTCSVGI
eukprot:365020-Chlamydomonas_euryale.AAC.1